MTFEQWYKINKDTYTNEEYEFAKGAWNTAIEECARVCDTFEEQVLKPAHEYSGQDVDCYHETAQRCAGLIRDLKQLDQGLADQF